MASTAAAAAQTVRATATTGAQRPATTARQAASGTAAAAAAEGPVPTAQLQASALKLTVDRHAESDCIMPTNFGHKPGHCEMPSSGHVRRSGGQNELRF